MSSFVVGDAILGATTVRQITDGYFAPGAGTFNQYGSTGVDPSTQFHDALEPTFRLTTEDLVNTLTALSITAGLYTSSAVTLPLRKRDQGGTYTSGSTHTTVMGDEGCLVVVDSISARQGQGQNISASLIAHFISADGLSPLTFSSSSAYSSESFSAAFGFGGASITTSGPTTTVPDCVGWTVNPGITVMKQRAGSGLCPTEVYISQREPSIELTFRSVADLGTLSATVKAITAVTVYGRRRTSRGTYVADDQTSHLAIAFGDCLGNVQQVGGGGRNSSEVTYRILGSTLTASAASTIS